MKLSTIAMLCHSINAAYCLSLGDDSQPTWENAPDEQKKSIEYGVKLHLENPETTPEQSHESWLKQKEAEGWVYAEEKNVELKEHPCFLPYDQLPQEQKSKDYIFRAVVHLVKDLPESSDHSALLVQLVSAQTQIKQYQSTLASSGSSSASGSSQAAQGVVLIYVGFKSEYTDRMYNSNVQFIHGKPKAVPQWLADKLLTHPEFELYKAPQLKEAQLTEQGAENEVLSNQQAATQLSNETLETIEQAKDQLEEKEQEENAVFDAKQMVDKLNDKDSLAEYAMKTFNQKIPKNQSVDWMKGKINDLIDQQGLPE